MSENENLIEDRENKACNNNLDDEIDLRELVAVIWKRRKFIISFVVIVVMLTVVGSLFMTNIYQSRAILVPVETKSGSSMAAAIMSQMGGLGSIMGTPDSASASEIKMLLESNILRKKIIHKYNLLPILFEKQWDSEKKNWKKEGFSLNPLSYLFKLIKVIKPEDKISIKKEPGIPDIYDCLEKLDGIINIQEIKGKGFITKDTAIIIAAEYEDPVMAKNLVNYFIVALQDHMSEEAKRVAALNKKYLEEQLLLNSDPLIQQKIYALIAQQVETAMMAEVKENFSFKIIDPPIVPDKKIRPKRAKMVVLCFFVSVLLAIFIVFVLEYLEKKNFNLKIKFLRKK